MTENNTEIRVATGRRWEAIVGVTPQFLSDISADFDDVLYMHAPADALPGKIQRIHVMPSDEDGLIVLKVYGREW